MSEPESPSVPARVTYFLMARYRWVLSVAALVLVVTGYRTALTYSSLKSELEELPADSRHGMMVTKVEQDSFADEIGMQERDVIVSINRIAVNSMDDIRKIQATLKPGSSVAFKVLRAEGISTRGQRVPRRSFFLSGTLPNQ